MEVIEENHGMDNRHNESVVEKGDIKGVGASTSVLHV